MTQHLFSLFIQTVPLVFVALFPVLNPIGTSIILLPLTASADEVTRRFVAKKVARNTFLLLTVVFFAGSLLLEFFGLSVPVVQVAGGLVIASMGWSILKADDSLSDEKVRASQAGGASVREQTFYPFTFPVSVGPGSVAVTLTLSAHTTQRSFIETVVSQSGAVIAFVGLAATVYLALAYTAKLLTKIGPSGTKVVMRLMAFIILCIGAQICWAGIHSLVGQLSRPVEHASSGTPSTSVGSLGKTTKNVWMHRTALEDRPE